MAARTDQPAPEDEPPAVEVAFDDLAAVRCACADCSIGDALPDRLQGWLGTYQLRLV